MVQPGGGGGGYSFTTGCPSSPTTQQSSVAAQTLSGQEWTYFGENRRKYFAFLPGWWKWFVQEIIKELPTELQYIGFSENHFLHQEKNLRNRK